MDIHTEGTFGYNGPIRQAGWDLQLLPSEQGSRDQQHGVLGNEAPFPRSCDPPQVASQPAVHPSQHLDGA